MISLVLALLVQSAAPAAQSSAIAFTNVNVLTMEDSRLRRQQTVVVTGSAITAMGPARQVRVPPGARIIDGGGHLVLMPGLTDSHVHLDLDAESWLPLFLASGITTVFNLRGDSGTLALRQRVRRGEVMGPGIYTAGYYTNLPAIRTPDDADRAVEDHRRQGYDFIKIHGDLGAETYARLTASAHAAGIPVIGHAPRNLPFAAVIQQRQDLVAHLEELLYTQFTTLDTAGLDSIAHRMAAADVWLIPTLATFAGIVNQWGRPEVAVDAAARPSAQLLPQAIRDYWIRQNPYTGRLQGAERAAAALTTQRSMIRTLQAAGVQLLAGTDTPVPVMVPGASLHDELDELVAAGLTPYQALGAATRNPGRFIATHLQGAALFGRVAVGQRADLLLLPGNPLDSLGLVRRPLGTMIGGRWLPRDTLDRMAAAVPALAARRATTVDAGIQLSEQLLRRYEGRFVTVDGRAVTVGLVDGRLSLTVPGQAPFVLGPTSDSTFRLLNSVTGLSAIFAESGALLRILQGGRVVAEGRRAGS